MATTRVFHLSLGKIQSPKITAVKDHIPFCDHIVSIDDEVNRSLLISYDKPILNKTETSLPLNLFDWSLPYEIMSF